MPDWVGLPAIRRARRANLYAYLCKYHPNEVTQEGDSLRLNRDHSVSIRSNWSGYNDFSNGGTGNAVECLVRYFGYNFQEAAAALAMFDGVPEEDLALPDETITLPGAPGSPVTAAGTAPASPPAPVAPQDPPTASQAPPKPFALPAAHQGPYLQLFAYLTQQRGIPPEMVRILIDDGLLYQEAGHANAVFTDPARTFAELRGTCTYAPFHRVMFSDPAAFWWFKPGGPAAIPKIAYVCEGAIDAISLYLYLVSDDANRAETGLYCSIAGVANQRRIDRIKSGMAAAGCQTVLAVDADDAGRQCCQRNPDCGTLLPWGGMKDWNLVLLACERDPSLRMAHQDVARLGRMARIKRYGRV